MPDRIAHYRILRLAGQGGMGEIYLARDEKLDRLVALKTIRPELLSDDGVRRRVLREARAAAALAHPFICTVHEAVEHEGQPVIVMEYVDGETVLRRVQSGPLPPQTTCRVGAEVAEALAAAHTRGVLHRDISAANVMIASDGHAKVMDFGLAQLKRPAAGASMTVTADLSIPGAIQGTPAYMPPEVLRGEAADARSDLYSLGVVLYLMATGRMPFVADSTASLLVEILTRAAASTRAIVPDVPWALDRVILRLLEKDPAQRFQTAAEVAEALLGAVSRPAAEAAPAQRTPSVAVLPFTPLGQHALDADFGLGLADATITDLALVRSLLVRPTSSIVQYRDRPTDVLAAGRELSVDAVVSGSFQRLGARVRVTVQLVSTRDGRPLWGTKIDTDLDDVFRLQDEVSRQIVQALEVQLTAREEDGLRRAARGAGPAQREYMRGRVALLTDSLESTNEAIEAFERAMTIDPSFAPAYAGLAVAYSRLSFSFLPDSDYDTRAVEMCEKALSLDPDLPEARYVRARLAWTPQNGFQHAVAVRELAAAIAAQPNLNEAFSALGMIVFHLGMLEESRSLLERAVAINPQDLYAFMHLAYARYLAADFRTARDVAEEAWRRAPGPWAGYQVALVDLHLGHVEDATRAIERASRQFPGDVLFFPLGAIMAALQNDRARARHQIELTMRHRKAFGHYHHAQYDVACSLALLGEHEEALEWLAQAAANGFPCYPLFERDPWLQSIRDTPRFTALMRTLREECAGYAEVYRAAMAGSGQPVSGAPHGRSHDS